MTQEIIKLLKNAVKCFEQDYDAAEFLNDIKSIIVGYDEST